MSEFIMTPTNIDFLEQIFRNPVTGKWAIPILTFNTNYFSPFSNDIDPLNDDLQYRQRVVDNFYLRLTEKWLYKDANFRKLLKYFKVEKNGEKGTVQLISDPEKVSDISGMSEVDRKYVLNYIEKYFITRHFVEKILKQFIKRTKAKWYDLFNNTDILKELFAHKLKKLIISTIYELQDREKRKD